MKLVRLIDKKSGRPIHISHEYSLEEDGGCSREEITRRFLKKGAALTVMGFLERAQPLPYSSTAIIDYPDIHFTSETRGMEA